MGAPAPLRPGASGGLTLRELTSADATACEEFFRHLGLEDIRMRFASLQASIRHLLPGAAPANDNIALAALDPAGAILGIANLVYVDSTLAEAAVIVRSDHKRRGIARALLEHAARRAEADRLARIAGYVLADNKPMLSLARAMGLSAVRLDATTIEVSRTFPRGAA